MAAEAGLGRERCQVGNIPRSEWQLGENLKVKYTLVARLVSGLSGPECVAIVSLGEKKILPVSPPRFVTWFLISGLNLCFSPCK